MYLLKLCLLSLTLTQVCSDFIQTFTGSTGWLRSVTGTSNNLTTLIYTGSWDGYVRKYDYSTGQQLQSFVNTGFVYQVLFSQIYGIFAASQDRAVRQWNNNGQLLNTMWGHRDQVCAVVIIGTFIYSGKLFINGQISNFNIGSADHDIIKWTLPNGNWASTLRGHTGTVWSLATYGNYLFSGAGGM